MLHSYEKLPQYAPSDVDMAVDSKDLRRAEGIVFDVAAALGFRVIQKLYYDIPRCFFYVLFFRDDDGTPGFVQLDFLNDDYGIGRYILKTSALLDGKRKFNNFYIPSIPVEACYLLIKKVIKKKFSPEHEAKLQSILKEDETAVKSILTKYFGSDYLDDIISLIEGVNQTEQARTIERLNWLLSSRYRILKPHLFVLHYLWFSKRAVERIFLPTGLVAIFVSPDGGGKSTVADMLLSRLRYGFRNTKRIHWRPYLLPPPRKLFNPSKWKEPETANYDPHGKPPKGLVSSVGRFFYYLLDYILGYLPKVFWLKVRTHLVVFERYYYDFLLDTRRFRLKVPSWLPVWFLPFVPKGDLCFLLSGPPHVLHGRKQEISLDEVKRQLAVIELLAKRLPNAFLINIDQPLLDEVAQVEDIIVDTLEKRLRKRTCQVSRG
ncbi:MAG: hypothetical protein C0399_08620 [Syntrophus sp. (in: bacteria)]|nr:hypothetical protein [Syntrophus sp. (in: bacteria)]